MAKYRRVTERRCSGDIEDLRRVFASEYHMLSSSEALGNSLLIFCGTHKTHAHLPVSSPELGCTIFFSFVPSMFYSQSYHSIFSVLNDCKLLEE